MKCRQVLFVLGFLGAGMLPLVSTNAQEKVPGPESASKNDKVADLFEERRRTDDTVWAEEIDAQSHEDVFVRIWDRLRKEKNAYEILSEVSFEALFLPDLKDVAAQNVDAGVHLLTASGPSRKYGTESWRSQLRRWKAAGYQLEQSEWHHQEFARNREGAAHSRISVTLHVRQSKPQKRFIVRGMLEISWKESRDSQGYYEPKHIRLTDLRIYERRGEPVFSEWATLAEKTEIQPILLRDLNGDGLNDIALAGCNVLYVNEGQGKFRRRPLCRFPTHGVKAAILADLTGDGVVDLLTASERDYPLLYKGGPQGRFDTPGELIVLPAALRMPQAITAGDVDADGDLDLWVSQYRPPYLEGQMPTPYWDANDGWPSYFLRNQGHGKFSDATTAAGLAGKRLRRTYANSFVDLDADGDLDLLVSSDFSGTDIYRNDGTGHFQDVTGEVVGESANFGMSHTIGDFNLDGRLDFFVLGMSSTTARRLSAMGLGRMDRPKYQAMRMKMGYGNRMYLAGPDGLYRQASFNDQVARSGWSWGSTNLDFDNDGDLDIYVSNGHQSRESAKDYCTQFWCHDIYTADSQPDEATNTFFSDIIARTARAGISWNGFEHNHFFMAHSSGFVNVGYLFGVGFEFDSRAVLSDDIDRDGRVDLLVVEAESLLPGTPRGERLHILRNNWQGTGNWIGVELQSGPDRPSPQGAMITVTQVDGTRRVVESVSGDSFRAQHSLQKHFGLGKAKAVEKIEVRFQDGTQRRIDKPQMNRYYRLR